MKKLSIALVIFFGVMSAYAAHVDAGKVMVGYYPNWLKYPPGPLRPAFTPWDIDASHLTHVNYAFSKPYPQAKKTGEATAEAREQSAKQYLDKLTDDQLSDSNVFSKMLFDPWADTDDVARPEKEATWVDNAEKETTKKFAGSFREMVNLKAKYPGLKTSISFGGWTLSDDFPAITNSSERRRKVASLMVNFANLYEFDGIDIDWEFPGFAEHLGTPEDKDNFTAFLKELRAQTTDHGLLLTIATSPDVKKVAQLDLKQIWQYVDWINVMGYDYNGPWGQVFTGHNAPLRDAGAPGGPDSPSVNGMNNITATMEAYLKDVPANKLVLGMPLYGRSFSGVEDNEKGGLFAKTEGKPGPGTAEEGVVSLPHLVNVLLSDATYKQYRDVAGGNVPYLYNSKMKTWISYDDILSLQEKAKFAHDKGLLGGMVWQLENDPAIWAAVKSIKDAL